MHSWRKHTWHRCTWLLHNELSSSLIYQLSWVIILTIRSVLHSSPTVHHWHTIHQNNITADWLTWLGPATDFLWMISADWCIIHIIVWMPRLHSLSFLQLVKSVKLVKLQARCWIFQLKLRWCWVTVVNYLPNTSVSVCNHLIDNHWLSLLKKTFELCLLLASLCLSLDDLLSFLKNSVTAAGFSANVLITWFSPRHERFGPKTRSYFSVLKNLHDSGVWKAETQISRHEPRTGSPWIKQDPFETVALKACSDKRPIVLIHVIKGDPGRPIQTNVIVLCLQYCLCLQWLLFWIIIQRCTLWVINNNDSRSNDLLCRQQLNNLSICSWRQPKENNLNT